jgi:hypothetical protein
MFALIAVAVIIVLGLVILAMRRGMHSETFDLGAVSTRWLSELRRDEPWTRS